VRIPYEFEELLIELDLDLNLILDKRSHREPVCERRQSDRKFDVLVVFLFQS